MALGDEVCKEIDDEAKERVINAKTREIERQAKEASMKIKIAKDKLRKAVVGGIITNSIKDSQEKIVQKYRNAKGAPAPKEA
jgi:hypothetical protein